MTTEQVTRRIFLTATCVITAGVPMFGMLPMPAFSAEVDANINVIGPKEGYSPQIGTLVSMMSWMRMVMLMPVKGMSQQDLDFLLDDKANRIGALLLHLAATDAYYHMHTFGGMKWGSWSDEVKKKWEIPMELGEPARKAIKDNNLDYYLNILTETREKTLAEFRKRDDKWLMTVDKDWPWGPTNNYCKWFHVCEHESNHNGQIKLLKSRLPGAKTGNE
ncbi:MAG: DUF664 domain-containing protein [Candidatus Acidiferrales bacterium]